MSDERSIEIEGIRFAVEVGDDRDYNPADEDGPWGEAFVHVHDTRRRGVRPLGGVLCGDRSYFDWLGFVAGYGYEPAIDGDEDDLDDAAREQVDPDTDFFPVRPARSLPEGKKPRCDLDELAHAATRAIEFHEGQRSFVVVTVTPVTSSGRRVDEFSASLGGIELSGSSYRDDEETIDRHAYELAEECIYNLHNAFCKMAERAGGAHVLGFVVAACAEHVARLASEDDDVESIVEGLVRDARALMAKVPSEANGSDNLGQPADVSCTVKTSEVSNILRTLPYIEEVFRDSYPHLLT